MTDAKKPKTTPRGDLPKLPSKPPTQQPRAVKRPPTQRARPKPPHPKPLPSVYGKLVPALRPKPPH